ncbi:non-ribosomal peptide synthetase [Sphingobacterium sp. DR205]|uniref:non-ribosomal peptide synthetase n=1 Tax=Sphingobacterium sp. DR205 TaxID=2713573 RepID=UPI0013E4D5B8|nr:non-ribosomal peptide synthetase [Sphingobacterium sp. DR205]QIH33424.1 amino acid adenylation domain-containing protein [Sphingobacterium sp. DR205]
MMEKIDLTLPQRDVLKEQIIYLGSSIYNIGALIEIQGLLDYNSLNIAYQHLIRSTDAFQAVLDEDFKSMRFQLGENVNLEYLDFSSFEDSLQKATDYSRSDFLKPFNLGDGTPLYRFCLIKICDEKWFLFSVYHHIIVDGWGTSLMFQRLVETYNCLIKNEKLPQFNYSYKAFVEDDLTYLNSETLDIDRKFWLERFIELPESFIPLLKNKQARSSRYQLQMSREIFNKIQDHARNSGVTQFHFLLGILYILLKKYFQQDDLTIGMPILNRTNSDFKKTVGLFMGINLLRIQVNDNLGFTELLKEIRKELRAIYKHQRYPVGRLIQELGCSRTPERLLNVTVSYEKQNYSDDFLNTKTIVRPLSHEQERVALALYIREFDDKSDIVIDFDYNLSYLSMTMVEDFVKSFQFVVNQTVSNPYMKISEIEILSEQYKHEIINKCKQDKQIINYSDTVVSFFKRSASQFPMKIAMQDGLDALTYSELDCQSNNLASRIIAIRNATGNKEPVAILMNRSCYLVVAIFGALKTGYPFVPIDPSFPKERIDFILRDSQSKLVLLDNDLLNLVNDSEFETLIVKNVQEGDSDERITYKPNQKQAAYLIYTSGTTGNPKGVEIGHRSLTNFLTSMSVAPGMTAEDLLYSVTTCSFDIFYLEILLPLINGAELYIARNEILSNPELVIEDLQKVKPTIMQSTPSFFQRLIDLGWPGSSHLAILSGGDTLNEKLAERLLERCNSLWNMYGPTETTIWSTVKKIKTRKDVRSLGMPIYNTNLYVLGKADEILPLGTVGRIFIGGEGLAKGYYNNEDLTLQKFIYHQDLKERIYDTGDLGRWNDLSEVELLGRDDYQVKIRGFRVEITEIENALSQISGIDQGIVIAKELNGFNRLIAYVVGSILDEYQIKSELKKALPSYMVPDRIIFLPYFPKTANGKVDRKILVNMPLTNDVKLISKMNSVEKKLAKIYENELGISGLNEHADFFDLGGHSMSMTGVIGRIKSQFGVDISLKDFYEKSSIRDLSVHIESLESDRKRSDNQHFFGNETFPLTESQKNIWYECQKIGKETLYNMEVAFAVEGYLDIDEMERYIQEIIDLNDTLNMNFRLIDNVPMQVFQKKERFKFCHLLGNEFNDVCFNFFNYEFDLEQDQLIRGGIYKEDQDVFLLFSTHHLIMDGYSVDLLIDQLAKRIQGISQIDYDNDKSSSFRKYLSELASSTEDDRAHEYWKGVFDDFKFKRILLPLADKFEDSTEYKIEIREQIGNGNFLWLKDLALEKNVTINTLTTLLVAVFVNRITANSEFMIGITYHGREQECYSKTLGMFVHTIPIKIKIDAETNILDHVDFLKGKIIDSYRYSNFPLSRKFYKQGLPFEVLVANQKVDSLFSDELHLKECRLLANKNVPYHESRVPLIFTVNEYNDKLVVSLTAGSMYSQPFTTFMLTSFYNLIMSFIQSPERPIKDFDVFYSNKFDEDFDFIF